VLEWALCYPTLCVRLCSGKCFCFVCIAVRDGRRLGFSGSASVSAMLFECVCVCAPPPVPKEVCFALIPSQTDKLVRYWKCQCYHTLICFDRCFAHCRTRRPERLSPPNDVPGATSVFNKCTLAASYPLWRLNLCLQPSNVRIICWWVKPHS
jgi:hypothetical protein